MNHQDGRCATPAETVWVENKNGCVATATGANASIGTMAMPACSMQPLTQLIEMNRRLVVVRGLVQASSAAPPAAGGGEISIVGQANAVVAGGASSGLQLSGAIAYVRSVAFKSSTLAGIRATASTLRLDGVLVENNTGGGIFLDTTRFSIVNTTVRGNGPGQEGTTTWGGVLINSLVQDGSKLLQRITVQNNTGTGISCIGGVQSMGVYASGNSPLDVQNACGITACTTLGPTCGAP
jgi:hypothetical protein